MNEYITEELIEATYLFCRKRISDNASAQDLAQDILLAALAAVRKGSQFVSFKSWYWRMARNKYADWAKCRNDPSLPLEIIVGTVSDGAQPIERLIDTEEIAELNYSLSRLAKIHRDIVIRYYLKQQSVAQIAAELNIPIGTVKFRLFDARKNLKERLDNMNNTGKAAYAPYEVDWRWGFACGEPEKVFRQKIAQQAAVICRKEPKSINEIADEMGIAPVYLEDILEQMAGVKLLSNPSKGKYRTNFCVFPRQADIDAYYAAYSAFLQGGYNERIYGALLSLKDEITSLEFYGNDFDYKYLMWILYVIAGDVIGFKGAEFYAKQYNDKYPDEPERSYRITELFLLPDEIADYSAYKEKAHNMSWSNLYQSFHTEKYGHVEYVNYFEYEPFPNDGDSFKKGRDTWVDGNNISLLIELAENPCKQLNEFEEEKAAAFIKHGLITKTDNGGLKVNLPIMSRNAQCRICELIEKAMMPIAEDYAHDVAGKVEKILLPHVRKDLMSNFVHWDMRNYLQPTGMLAYYGLYDSGNLQMPEDFSRSAAALFIVKR